MLQKSNSSNLRLQERFSSQPSKKLKNEQLSTAFLRENLLIEVCKNDDELLEKTKQRLLYEKKEKENNLVKERLQSKITKMFSSKNVTPHGIKNLPYEMNAISRSVDMDTHRFDNLNNLRKKVKSSASRDDLCQIINIHANKQIIGGKKQDSYTNNKIPQENQKNGQNSEAQSIGNIVNLFNSQSQFKPDSEISPNIPHNLEVSIGKINLNETHKDPTQQLENYTQDQTPNDNIYQQSINESKQKRKQDVASLKISTQEKQRLHKRRQIIISMKFIRNLGKRLRQDLEKQGVVIKKFQKSHSIKLKKIKKQSFKITNIKKQQSAEKRNKSSSMLVSQTQFSKKKLFHLSKKQTSSFQENMNKNQEALSSSVSSQNKQHLQQKSPQKSSFVDLGKEIISSFDSVSKDLNITSPLNLKEEEYYAEDTSEDDVVEIKELIERNKEQTKNQKTIDHLEAPTSFNFVAQSSKPNKITQEHQKKKPYLSGIPQQDNKSKVQEDEENAQNVEQFEFKGLNKNKFMLKRINLSTQPALNFYGVMSIKNNDINQLDGLSPNTPQTNSKDSVDYRVTNENFQQFFFKEQQVLQIQALREKTLSYVSEDLELEDQESNEIQPQFQSFYSNNLLIGENGELNERVKKTVSKYKTTLNFNKLSHIKIKDQTDNKTDQSPSKLEEINSDKLPNSAQNINQKSKKSKSKQANPDSSSELVSSTDSEEERNFLQKNYSRDKFLQDNKIVDSRIQNIQRYKIVEHLSNISSGTSLSRGSNLKQITKTESLTSESQSLSSFNESLQESLKKMTVTSKDPRLKLEPMPRRDEIQGNDDDLSESEEYYLTEIEIMNNADLMEKIARDEKLIWEEICQVQMQNRNKKISKQLNKKVFKNRTMGIPKSRCSKVSISKYSNQNLSILRKQESFKGSLSSEVLDSQKIAKIRDIKSKMQKQHTKKQVFAFNIFKNHVRQLSELELFQKKSDLGSISSHNSIGKSDSRSKNERSKTLKAKLRVDLNLKGQSSDNIMDLGNKTAVENQRSLNYKANQQIKRANFSSKDIQVHLRGKTSELCVIDDLNLNEKSSVSAGSITEEQSQLVQSSDSQDKMGSQTNEFKSQAIGKVEDCKIKENTKFNQNTSKSLQIKLNASSVYGHSKNWLEQQQMEIQKVTEMYTEEEKKQDTLYSNSVHLNMLNNDTQCSPLLKNQSSQISQQEHQNKQQEIKEGMNKSKEQKNSASQMNEQNYLNQLWGNLSNHSQENVQQFPQLQALSQTNDVVMMQIPSTTKQNQQSKSIIKSNVNEQTIAQRNSYPNPSTPIKSQKVSQNGINSIILYQDFPQTTNRVNAHQHNQMNDIISQIDSHRIIQKQRSESKTNNSKNQASSRVRNISNELFLGTKQKSRNQQIHTRTNNNLGNSQGASSLLSGGKKFLRTVQDAKILFDLKDSQSYTNQRNKNVFSKANFDRNKNLTYQKKNMMKDVKNNLIELCIDLGVENPSQTDQFDRSFQGSLDSRENLRNYSPNSRQNICFVTSPKQNQGPTSHYLDYKNVQPNDRIKLENKGRVHRTYFQQDMNMRIISPKEFERNKNNRLQNQNQIPTNSASGSPLIRKVTKQGGKVQYLSRQPSINPQQKFAQNYEQDHYSATGLTYGQQIEQSPPRINMSIQEYDNSSLQRQYNYHGNRKELNRPRAPQGYDQSPNRSTHQNYNRHFKRAQNHNNNNNIGYQNTQMQNSPFYQRQQSQSHSRQQSNSRGKINININKLVYVGQSMKQKKNSFHQPSYSTHQNNYINSPIHISQIHQDHMNFMESFPSFDERGQARDYQEPQSSIILSKKQLSHNVNMKLKYQKSQTYNNRYQQQ